MDLEPISNAFRTDRLVIEVLRDHDEDEALVQEIYADPVTSALSNNVLLLPYIDPMGEKNLAAWMIKHAMVMFKICLPAAVGEQEPSESESTATTKPKNKPIGFASLVGKFDHHRQASCGIALHKDYQNSGYGTEALKWVVNYGFRFANLHRLALQVLAVNERAVAVYKKVGFVEEGRHRDKIFLNGKYFDVLSMSILDHEWDEVVRAKKPAEASSAPAS